jgi:hypothetical protein
MSGPTFDETLIEADMMARRDERLAAWDTMPEAERNVWIAEAVMRWEWCRHEVSDGARFALYSPGRAAKDYLVPDRRQPRPKVINWNNPPWETPPGGGFLDQRVPAFTTDPGAGVAVRDAMAGMLFTTRTAFLQYAQAAVTHRLGLKNGVAAFDEVALRATAADWCEAAYMTVSGSTSERAASADGDSVGPHTHT